MNFPIKTLSQLRPILQGFRKQAGLTQADMASRLGITQQSYAQIEANPASTSVERLHKILSLLNVDLMLAAAPGTPAPSGHPTGEKGVDSAPATVARTVSTGGAGASPRAAPPSLVPPSGKKESW